MITLIDSMKLAYTKVRTRRIRLFIVLFVSSLLFSGLVAGSLVVTGALNSFREFSDEGFTDRYIVAGKYTNSNVFNSGVTYSPEIYARVEALEKDEQARKTAEAKRLGIEYVQNEAEKAVFDDGSGHKSLNPNSPIAAKALAEYDASNPLSSNLDRFKQQTGNDAIAYYESLSMAPRGGMNNPTLSVIQDGKEDTATGGKANFGPGTTKGLDGLSQDWTLMDGPLLTPFLLKGQNLEMGKDNSIPIIASYSAAQELLKLPALDSKATNEQKKQRLSEVRDKIAGVTFQICYRNSTSYADFQNAIQQQADVKANQNKKDYEKPDLIYAPNPSACAAPVVQRDVRTTQEKNLTNKQAEFDRIFGKPDPTSEILTFRIVGLSPDRELPQGISVRDILSSVLSSTVGSNWASPRDVLEKVPAAQDVFKKDYAFSQFLPQETYYAEYKNPDVARTVLKDKTCTVLYPGAQLQEGQVACSPEKRPFMLQTFGSASLAIDEFQSGFRKIQLIVAGVIALIASVILMGMIGRIIADARKETAVFRALGASRLAISQIYIMYTLYLALLTILIALVIGFGFALWVDRTLGPDTSITMALLFNVGDLSQPFHFYGLDFYDVGLIGGVIIVACVVGSLIPIAHNVSRNPIKDMREE